MNYVNVLAASAALALGISTAQATVINYQASGSGTDGALFGVAHFTTGTGFIDITLTNALAANVIRSSGQALSDLSFTLSNAPGTLGTTTATGQQGNISNSGVVTYTTGSPGRFLGTGGGSFSITGNTILMEALGGGMPSQMIAPAIADGGTYTNVNNGFNNFDPYTIGPATFVLNLSGVTASTTVTAAAFSFGTNPDGTPLPGSTCVDCGPGTTSSNSVPEPASMLVLGAGLVGLGAARRWLR